jgi:hypothetical protein
MLSQEGLRSPLEVKQVHRYPNILSVAGGTIAAFVEECAIEWQAGSRTNPYVEKRLEGKVEDVA